MKVDTYIDTRLHHAGESARQMEHHGFDGGWASEISHDPFLALALAADSTDKLELGTSIAVAFARNPMTLATLGWDLQKFSGGRLTMGLGSQIRPHITKRFSMPWSQPALRMRELVLAMRAIWEAWELGTPLRFEGDFYTHTLMTPMFTPERDLRLPWVPPRIFLAGVGELMTEVAGEVADGFFCHSFTTEQYLREVTLPALARGRKKAGRTMEGFQVSSSNFVVTGTDEQEWNRSKADIRKQLAFYSSTPAYRPVMEMHGWGELQRDLHTLSKESRWDDMTGLIDDEVLDTLAIVAEPQDVADTFGRRFGDLVQRFTFSPLPDDVQMQRRVRADLQAL